MTDDIRSALIAAAVAGDLTPEESRALETLRAGDPTIDEEITAEIDALRTTASRLDVLGGEWLDDEPSAALRARIAGLAARTRADGATDARTDPDAPGASRPLSALPSRRRRGWLLPLTAAACIGLGLAIGLAVPPLLHAPPSGPPGTLGAIEHIELSGEPEGVQIDADLVAHTWGTEAVIEATGLDVGRTYAIVVVGRDGREFSAGEMLGSRVPILCHLNAAVLREEVAAVIVRDADGAEVAHADVPRA